MRTTPLRDLANESLGPAQAGGASRLAMQELVWRQRPTLRPQQDSIRAILCKWSLAKPIEPIEFCQEITDGNHTITINRTVSAGLFSYRRKQIQLKNVAINSSLLVPPGEASRIVFTDAADAYRLYLPQTLLEECYQGVFGVPASGDIVLGNVAFLEDRPVLHLIHAMLEIGEENCQSNQMVLESISMAIASRCILLSSKRSVPQARVSPLAKWRLQRVIEYVDAHIFEPIYLQDLSNVAGLSRMHFSSQFRLATGATPNAYVVKMRIGRAQRLIRETDLSLLAISEILGFKSQSHFTLVFRKVVGHTPARWRAIFK